MTDQDLPKSPMLAHQQGYNEGYEAARKDLRDEIALEIMKTLIQSPDMDPGLKDEDMKKDPDKGIYVKAGKDSYYIPQLHEPAEPDKYRPITTYSERLWREAYRIADEQPKAR